MPIRRPLLPRASSATSGFFFWGSIELPVAKASSRTAKPNSSVDHSTSLLADARQVHAEERQVEEGLGHEVAVGHRVERVLEPPGESEVGPGSVGVERQGRAGQCSGPSGETSSRATVATRRSTSRASAQPWASRWWASSTGWARCRWV